MPEKYHKYVFDTAKKAFVGKFEEMYRNEAVEGFDSWHQDDTRHLNRKIAMVLLEDYNFERIVDVGCGKGSFTHCLKKKNNIVVGIDISPKAIEVAKERYPDIDFQCVDLSEIDKLHMHSFFKSDCKTDLIICSEVLSYIEDWKTLIEFFSSHAKFILISLFIPDKPIGYVNSESVLIKNVEKNYFIIECVSLRKTKATIIFARSKTASDHKCIRR